MANVFQAAVILTAYDRMSRVVAQAAAASEASLRGLNEKAQKYGQQGMGMMGAGAAGAAMLYPAISAFSTLENSSAGLQSQMLETGGTINRYFDGVNNLAVQLGNKLPGTTADLQEMMTVLLQNNTAAEDILGGVGSAAAKLALVLKMPYASAAEFAAQLRISTGVAANDMEAFMDVIQRTRSMGINPSEMGYAFGRAGLKQFGMGGLEDSKALAALFSTIIPITKSGETTGSGLSRLMTAVFDTSKMAAANEQLSKYGIHWDFIDKTTGKFKGVENMVGQLGQLQGMNDATRLKILTSIFGEGEDRKIAAIIAANGVAGYNQAIAKMANQGTLDQKVAVQVATLSNMWEAATGTVENAMAAIGASIGPEMKGIVDLFNRASAALQNFAMQHPKIFKFISLFIALSSAIMMVAGAIKIVRAAMILMQVFALTNPVTLIIMAIAAAALLVYTYWSDIAGFFQRIWDKIAAGARAIGLDKLFLSIKNLVVGTFKFIWMIVSNFTPLGLLIKNWDKVLAALKKIGSVIKAVFSGVWDFITGLAGKFWDVGLNIVKMIIGGITSMIDKAGEAIGNITKKIRSFLPFSPAKEGAFRDLHRVKIIETIASSLVPGPLLNAMSKVTGAVAGSLNSPSSQLTPAGNSAGGGLVVNYAPVINMGAGATGSDFMAILRAHKDEIAKIVADATARKGRVTY